MSAVLDRARLPLYKASLADPEFMPAMARKRLLHFTRRMFGPAYLVGRHHRLIADALEDVSRGDTRYLAIIMPPRHGKTEMASVHFPAWHLGNHPDERIIAVSYGADLANRNSRKARNLLLHPQWPFPDVRLAGDMAQVAHWNLAERRGGYDAAGIGGPVTGMGANIFLVDDPVKSQDVANSLAEREHAWEWFQATAATRLEPNGRIVLIGTRWHESDLIGQALGMGLDWRVLWLPAQAEPTEGEPDLLGRADGEYLWPERFAPDEYAEIKKRVGERNWLTQYQGQPYSDTGGTFKREWFSQRYRDAALPRMREVCIAIDSAFKEGVANDYSVMAAWGADGNGGYYLLGRWRDKVEFPELIDAGYDQWRRWRAKYADAYLLPEDKASGQSAIQVWKRGDSARGRPRLPTIPVKVPAGESKVSRAEGVTHLFESGQVWLPDGAPWLDEWIEEHIRFPFGAHDDQVDTTSLALARLSRPKASGIVTM